MNSVCPQSILPALYRAQKEQMLLVWSRTQACYQNQAEKFNAIHRVYEQKAVGCVVFIWQRAGYFLP